MVNRQRMLQSDHGRLLPHQAGSARSGGDLLHDVGSVLRLMLVDGAPEPSEHSVSALCVHPHGCLQAFGPSDQCVPVRPVRSSECCSCCAPQPPQRAGALICWTARMPMIWWHCCEQLRQRCSKQHRRERMGVGFCTHRRDDWCSTRHAQHAVGRGCCMICQSPKSVAWRPVVVARVRALRASRAR